MVRSLPQLRHNYYLSAVVDQRDVIEGLGESDLVHGCRGDTPYGNPGADAVYGNLVYGGIGNDFVRGGHISTGDGSDKVAARDGYQNRIVCGWCASDVAYNDSFDTTQSCEGIKSTRVLDSSDHPRISWQTDTIVTVDNSILAPPQRKV